MKFQNIQSIKDEKVVFARSLHSHKGRVEAKAFLVEGLQAIEWLLESPCHLDTIFAHDKCNLQDLDRFTVPVYLCSEGIMKKISGTNYLVLCHNSFSFKFSL